MANRNFSEFSKGLDKEPVTLYAVVNVGAAGAVTFQQWNPSTRTYSAASATGFRGVKSVVKNAGAGSWTVTLQDSYQRVLQVSAVSSIAGGSAAAPVLGINATTTNVNSNTAATIGLQFLSSGGTAADPASGEQILLQITLQNSSAL